LNKEVELFFFNNGVIGPSKITSRTSFLLNGNGWNFGWSFGSEI
jgi:hypothetical protein